ncbi:MAG: metallophosphoesterase family protein [Fibrobacter sp.]|nr:metallophosphoesterase family protein [Fibrobacter sp.]
MLYGVFSDIHSNATAFKAVIKSMEEHGVQRRICLGDLVGYGVDANECVSLTKANADVSLIGNHDNVAIRFESSVGFNPYAKQMIEWTQKELSEESISYIKQLPYILEENDTTFVHASPMSPADWIYITDLEDAYDAFEYFNTSYCFVGHTHSPIIVTMRGGGAIPKVIEESKYQVQGNERLLVNVGSVGQPRDRNPDAAWCLFDTEAKSVEIVRVQYDILETQTRMRAQAVPEFLVERLGVGR